MIAQTITPVALPVFAPDDLPVISASPLASAAASEQNDVEKAKASKFSKKVIAALAVGALATIAAVYVSLQNSTTKMYSSPKEPQLTNALIKYQAPVAPAIQPKYFFIKGVQDQNLALITPINAERNLILRDKIVQDVILAQPIFLNEIISTTHQAKMCNLSPSNLVALPMPPAYKQFAAEMVIEPTLFSNHSSALPPQVPQQKFYKEDSLAQAQCAAEMMIEPTLFSNHSSALPSQVPQQMFSKEDSLAQTPCDPATGMVNNAIKGNFFNRNLEPLNFTYGLRGQYKV